MTPKKPNQEWTRYRKPQPQKCMVSKDNVIVRDGLSNRPLLFPDVTVACLWAEDTFGKGARGIRIELPLAIDASVTRQMRKKERDRKDKWDAE